MEKQMSLSEIVSKYAGNFDELCDKKLVVVVAKLNYKSVIKDQTYNLSVLREGLNLKFTLDRRYNRNYKHAAANFTASEIVQNFKVINLIDKPKNHTLTYVLGGIALAATVIILLNIKQ